MNRTARLALTLTLAVASAIVVQPASAQCTATSGWMDLYLTRGGTYSGTFASDTHNGSIAITPLLVEWLDPLVPPPAPAYEILYVDNDTKGTFRALIEIQDQPITKDRVQRTGKGSIYTATFPWEGFYGSFALSTKVNFLKGTQKGEAYFNLCGPKG